MRIERNDDDNEDDNYSRVILNAVKALANVSSKIPARNESKYSNKFNFVEFLPHSIEKKMQVFFPLSPVEI